MKTKSVALKGLIMIAVVVVLCMFFARTVQTITTPKVSMVTGTTGRFEQDMKFTAQVYFPRTDEVLLEDAAKSNVTVDKLYVQAGHWVSKGDTILTTHMGGYKEEMEKIKTDYDAKARELLDLDVTNRKLSKESKANELYDTMVDAQTKLSEKMYETRYAAMQQGITLSGDVTQWKKQLAVLKDVPKEVTAAVDETVAVKGTLDAAKSAFNEIMEDRKQRVKDDVFKYINDRNKLIDAMDQLQEDMVALDGRKAALETVKAPHDGYIAEIGVASGDACDGTKTVYRITAEGTIPQLRASLDGVTRTISEGMKVSLESDTYGTEKTTVESVARGTDSVKYMYIALPESMQEQGNSAIRKAVSDGGVQVTITYRASKSTTLLPPSAVRNEGENSDYVWLIQRSYGGVLSSGGLKVVKTSVHVLERGDKAVAIEDDLSYQQVADKEDRTLTDGQTVMEYVN